MQMNNETTIKAFEEGEELLNNPDAQRFTTIEDLFKDLDS